MEWAVNFLDTRDMAEELIELGSTLAQVQQWEKAQAVWDRAEQVIANMEDDSLKIAMLNELGKVLVQAQQWDRMRKVCNEMERMASTENWNSDWRWSSLAEVLMMARQWEESEHAIVSIKDENEHKKSFGELGGFLILAGEWKKAERVARDMQNEERKAEILLGLGKDLSRMQQWEEAKRIIGEIRYDGKRAEALTELGKALIQTGEWEEAERIAGDNEGVLQSIAQYLTSIREYEDLLHFVQRRWLQTDTWDDAVTLLPLAYGLIPLKPEMGSAFFESFAWVDAFLEGNDLSSLSTESIKRSEKSR
jgi:tetratricopeptide (TPR) repeat protein